MFIFSDIVIERLRAVDAGVVELRLELSRLRNQLKADTRRAADLAQMCAKRAAAEAAFPYYVKMGQAAFGRQFGEAPASAQRWARAKDNAISERFRNALGTYLVRPSCAFEKK